MVKINKVIAFNFMVFLRNGVESRICGGDKRTRRAVEYNRRPRRPGPQKFRRATLGMRRSRGTSPFLFTNVPDYPQACSDSKDENDNRFHLE
jgi:hypothetical protein